MIARCHTQHSVSLHGVCPNGLLKCAAHGEIEWELSAHGEAVHQLIVVGRVATGDATVDYAARQPMQDADSACSQVDTPCSPQLFA